MNDNVCHVQEAVLALGQVKIVHFVVQASSQMQTTHCAVCARRGDGVAWLVHLMIPRAAPVNLASTQAREVLSRLVDATFAVPVDFRPLSQRTALRCASSVL